MSHVVKRPCVMLTLTAPLISFLFFFSPPSLRFFFVSSFYSLFKGSPLTPFPSYFARKNPIGSWQDICAPYLSPFCSPFFCEFPYFFSIRQRTRLSRNGLREALQGYEWVIYLVFFLGSFLAFSHTLYLFDEDFPRGVSSLKMVK